MKDKIQEQQLEYFILMGDIIKSSQYTYNELKIFRKIIDEVNAKFDLVSPLTITLGDEFQGIVKSLTQGVNIIFTIEERLIKNLYPFSFRYSLGFGEIITPINSKIAHGMYGEGLTKMRDLLEESKKDKRRRFDMLLPIKNFNNLFNNLFFIYQSFLDNWKEKDYKIIEQFYENKDYKEVAKKLGKGSDQIWKREKNLRIREFFEMQDIILKLTESYSKLHDSRNVFHEILSELLWKTFKESKDKKVFKDKLINEKLFNEKIEEVFSYLIPI